MARIFSQCHRCALWCHMMGGWKAAFCTWMPFIGIHHSFMSCHSLSNAQHLPGRKPQRKGYENEFAAAKGPGNTSLSCRWGRLGFESWGWPWQSNAQFFGWTWLRSGPMEPEFPPSPPKPQQFGPEAGWMYPMPLHRDPIYEYEGPGLTNCHLCSIKQNMNTKCGRKMPRTSCCDGFQGLWQRLDCLVVWNVFLFNNV